MLDRPKLSQLDLEDLISEAGTAGALIDVIADMLNTCRVVGQRNSDHASAMIARRS